MNLNIFFDDDYFNKLVDFMSFEKIDNDFPFLEMRIDPDNLINGDYDQTPLYTFLKSVHFFYYYAQSYYGYVQLDGKYYIIEVGDELDMLILGDNEINWTKLLFDKESEYNIFKSFCLNKYKINYKEPDHVEFRKIREKYMNFWGFL
jgi:hypothetical protein